MLQQHTLKMFFHNKLYFSGLNSLGAVFDSKQSSPGVPATAVISIMVNTTTIIVHEDC